MLAQRFEILPKKKLVGKYLNMSFANNKTVDLWKSFMTNKATVKNNIGSALYSLQIYPAHFFKSFSPNTEFEKWALIEVSDFTNIPKGMKSFTLEEGLYSVFIHKGPASKGPESFKYIFETWLPNSNYQLDNRPHFELLGEKYKNEDLNSEEEIWIPIKEK